MRAYSDAATYGGVRHSVSGSVHVAGRADGWVFVALTDRPLTDACSDSPDVPNETVEAKR
jgi:hypothetical protein